MRSSYYSLALFLLTAISLRFILQYFDYQRPVQISKDPILSDGESELAITGKLDLAQAEIYELELISGISDTLAKEILSRREQIIWLAARLSEKRKHEALEIVHGIGPKTSIKLGEVLRLSPATKKKVV